MKDEELISTLIPFSWADGEFGLKERFRKALAQVRADEREAVAQFVEISTTRQTKYELAKAIRERGK